MITVCSGGNDKKNFSYKIIKKLKKIKDYKIQVILGKGVSFSNPVFKYKRDKNVTILKNQKNIFNLLNSSDIAFVTGGTTMFEAICCGTEPFVAQSYENQKFAIKYFMKNNLINYLGKVSKLKLNEIEKKINNYTFSKKLFKKRINIIDGKGLTRVIKIIDKIFEN